MRPPAEGSNRGYVRICAATFGCLSVRGSGWSAAPPCEPPLRIEPRPDPPVELELFPDPPLRVGVVAAGSPELEPPPPRPPVAAATTSPRIRAQASITGIARRRFTAG